MFPRPGVRPGWFESEGIGYAWEGGIQTLVALFLLLVGKRIQFQK